MRRAIFLLLLAVTARVAHADVPTDLAALAAAVPACDATRAHCVGLRLHVAADDQGVVVATPAWVAAEFAAVNRHYAPLDVGFQLVSVDGLPASTVHVANREDRNAFARRADGNGVVDVFVVTQLDDVDKDHAIIHGVTWRRPGKVYIIIVGTAMERTLAHELGHVFGLPHSTYAISIMNKSARDEPPMEQRTFADEEIAKMKPNIARMFRTKALLDQPHPSPSP